MLSFLTDDGLVDMTSPKTLTIHSKEDYGTYLQKGCGTMFPYLKIENVGQPKQQRKQIIVDFDIDTGLFYYASKRFKLRAAFYFSKDDKIDKMEVRPRLSDLAS